MAIKLQQHQKQQEESWHKPKLTFLETSNLRTFELMLILIFNSILSCFLMNILFSFVGVEKKKLK